MSRTDSNRIAIKSIDEFSPGEREIVEVEGISIGVFNIDGNFYALQNTCCHDGGPTCEGRIRGRLVGEFVESGKRVKERLDEANPAIACPWHGWEYDIKTGEHLANTGYSLRTYEVAIEDDTVYIELE